MAFLMKPKYPGMCIICEGDMPKDLRGNVCSQECARELFSLDAREMAALIQLRFVVDPNTAESLKWATDHPEQADQLINGKFGVPEKRLERVADEYEDFPRPMGVTAPRKPKVVTYKRDTSPFTWYKGKTDAEVAEDFLASV